MSSVPIDPALDLANDIAAWRHHSTPDSADLFAGPARDRHELFIRDTVVLDAARVPPPGREPPHESFIRDTLVLDAAFRMRIVQRVGSSGLPVGSTIVVAARDLKFGVDAQGHGFRLSILGYDLLLLADSLDMRGGAIDQSGSRGTNGATGEEGFPGRNGGDGNDGAPGANVYIYCRQLVDVTVISRGGTGGDGGRGGNGGIGPPGDPGHVGDPTMNDLGYPPVPGGDGGAGADGGRGGDGGNSGQIAITFVEDLSPGGFDPATRLSHTPGAGGHGGDPGQGGPGGYQATSGADGALGGNGTAGQDRAPIVRHVDVATLVAQMKRDFGTAAQEWADYRLRVADFEFRAYRPDSPTSPDFTAALVEYSAVLALDPQNARALLHRNWLVSNKNILGLARDADVIPDFRRFEDVVSSYGPLVADVFHSANFVLGTQANLAEKSQELQVRIASLQDFMQVLAAEKVGTLAGLQAAQAESTRAAQRLANLQAALDRAARDHPNVIVGDILVGTAIVIGFLAGVITGGGALMAMIPAVIDVTHRLQANSHLTTQLQDKNFREDFQKAAGGLKDLIEGIQDAIAVGKMIADLAPGDPAAPTIEQQIELVHGQLLANLHVIQARAAVDAAAARQVQTSNELQQTQQIQAALSADVQVLGAAARALVQTAQASMDVLIKYAFLAARSLEIYTLVNLQSTIRYDYGYVHPDVEEDADISQLMAAYATSWSQFVNVVNLRDQYEQYFSSGNVVSDILYLTVNDPAVIARFRASADLQFSVSLAMLPANRFEAKVLFVHMALIGAQAAVPTIACVVEHSGRYTQKKRDGTNVDIILGPRPAIVQAAFTALGPAGMAIGDPTTFAPWGRGVAAIWHVYIEADELTRSGANLAGLSSIEIAIGYQAFLQ